MELQTCTNCNKDKPLTLEFFYFKKNRNRFYRECKQCFAIRNASRPERTEEEKERYKSAKIKYYTEVYKGTEIHRLSHKKAKKRYYEAHPMQKIADRIRGRTRKALTRQKLNKTSKFNNYLGCDLETLKNHLEIQFQPEMTWENYGKWHIDHIIPLISANTEEELFKLSHYTNLQPLWAIDNIRKKDKY